MKRILRRALFVLVSTLILLSLLGAVLGVVLPRRSFPLVRGELHLPGLQAPVEVFRDEFGVPHIFAETKYDLFFTQGYVHAQDRFWQMDFWRHLGSGRLSEMFGESQLETDQFLRTLGWARVVQEELEQMDSESLLIFQAYADGVNAYLASRTGSALSLEYAILKLLTPGYRPEPWEPVHTLTWAKVMAWDLGGNLDKEIERAILLDALSPAQLADLTPSYPSNHPLIVSDFAPISGSRDSSLETRQIGRLSPTLDLLNHRLKNLNELAGTPGDGIGSNSWVVSGELTATGMPILANDPHLGAQIPSIWYEIGLHCAPKSADCPYQVTGFSFAGAPAVIIGHNDRIAWGFTNINPDVMDLYIEKVNPDNPNQYEFEGEWEEMRLVNETIQTGKGEPVELTVRYTHHGPIISDTYLPEDFSEKAGIDIPASSALSLRWTALEPGSTFRAIFLFNRAQNWEEFRQAASYFDVPSQSLVYADVEGNIGYQMPGKIPIRARGDGGLPAPGWTGEYEWQGYIPFEQLPFSFNPPEGYVITANNAVVGPEYPFLLSLEWDYGYRALRLAELIHESPGPIDISYTQLMQGDNKNLNAERLVPVLLGILREDGRFEEYRQILEGWDYQQHMDSSAAAIFEVFWKNLLAETFHDDLPDEFWPEGGSRWFTVLGELVDQPDSPWWDNRNTPEIENRDRIFMQAFEKGIEELEGRLGKNASRWGWGDLHTLTLTSQTMGRIPVVKTVFNRGPFRTSGGSSIVNATGWGATGGYQVVSLPSMRMIVDLGNLQNSLSIHPAGQTGHAYHPNYIDMVDLWRNIDYRVMLWQRGEIEAASAATLRLEP